MAISLVCDLLVLGLLAALRLLAPEATPDPESLLREGWDYAGGRLGQLFLWGVGLMTAACAFAWIASRPNPVGSWWTRTFAPVISDVSAWYYTFESGPGDARIWIECHLVDETRVAGYLDWYSTEVTPNADRELVIARAVELRRAAAGPVLGERTILAARDIRRLHVEWHLLDN